MDMKRRAESGALIDYFVARLVCRFIDHGEPLEDAAAIAEFWCHQVAAERPLGFQVSVRRFQVGVQDDTFEVEALSQVSSSHAITAYLCYAGSPNGVGGPLFSAITSG